MPKPLKVPEPQEEPLPSSAAYRLTVGTFEGPLDLLLHLCQKHEIDILDIPISFVTAKYLEYLAVMTLMNLDVASEYLVMAATLAHIKSKMLLPVEPKGQDDDLAGEDEVDPREQLIRRLLEYQKYKHAAEGLAARGIAGQDVFFRGAPAPDAVHVGLAPLAEVPLYSLLEAFQQVLARSKVKLSLDVVADRISLTDRISELSEALGTRRRVIFEALFDGLVTRFDLVITFLALLEMARQNLVRLYQSDPLSPLYIECATLAPDAEEDAPLGAGAEATDEDRAARARTPDREASTFGETL